MEIKKYQAHQSKQNRYRLGGIFLSLAIFLLYLSVTSVYYFQHPIDGLSGEYTPQGFRVQEIFFVPSDQSKITESHLITAVENVSLVDNKNLETELPQLFGTTLQNNAEITYTFQDTNTNETFTEVVKVRQLAFYEFLKVLWLKLISIVFFFMLSLFVLFKKPTSLTVWLNLILFQGSIFILQNLLPFLTNNSSPFLSVLQEMSGVVFSIVLLIFLHYSFYFPTSNFKPKRKNQIVGVAYAATTIYLITRFIAQFLGISWLLSILSVYVANILALVYIITASAVLVYSYKKADDPVYRAQLKWPLWSITIVVLPILVINQLGIIFTGRVYTPPETAALVALVFFTAISISLVRFKLFAIDTIINRSIVYGIVSTVLSLIYVTISLILTSIINQSFSAGLPSAPQIISVITVVLIFNPVRNFTQRVTDNLLFRQKIKAEKIVLEISEELARTNEFDELSRILLINLPQKIGASKALLYIYSHQGMKFNGIGDQAKEVQAALLHYMFRVSEKTDTQYIVYDEITNEEQPLKQTHVEVAFPIKQARSVIGFYVLGKRNTGEGYSLNEIEAIEAIVNQMALALRHAQTYEDLKEKNQKIDSLLQNITEGVIMINQQGTVVQVNKQTLKQFDTNEETLLKQKYVEAFEMKETPESDKRIDPVETSLVTQLPTSEKLYMRHKSRNEWLPVTLFANPLYIEGNYQGTVLTTYDRTDEENLLSQKDSFIATAAHEFRTPMLIIKTHVKNLVNYVTGQPKDATVEKTMSSLQEAIINLDSKVEQILSISSLQDEAEVIKTDKLSVEELLGNINTIFGNNQQGISFDVNNPNKDEFVAGHLQYLLKVLKTLIYNALEFTQEGGTITISTTSSKSNESIIPPTEAKQNRYIVFSIQDTGQGIDPEIRDRLFTPFIQQGGALERNQIKGGLGLGLYFVKLVIQKHGGKVWFESEQGKGSTFYFSLPVWK